MSAKKKTSPLPRVTTRTITVRSLLRKIQRLILDEPRRLNMLAWVSVFRGRVVHEGVLRTHTSMPACGTVACLAGWGAVLLRPDRTPGVHLDDMAESVIGELIGRGSEGGRYAGELFSPDHTSLDDSDVFPFALPQPGSREHADAIAKRIDTYMARNPQILSRKIDVAAARKLLSGRA